MAEAQAEAVKAAEKLTGDLKALIDLSTEMAEDEGKAQGQPLAGGFFLVPWAIKRDLK